MQIQRKRRPVGLLAVVAFGVFVAWWASRPARDERFVGRWALNLSVTFSFEADGTGIQTDQSTKAQTPIRWWTTDDALYVDARQGALIEVVKPFLRMVVRVLDPPPYDSRRWSVEVIEPDRIKVKTPNGGGDVLQRIDSELPN